MKKYYRGLSMVYFKSDRFKNRDKKNKLAVGHDDLDKAIAKANTSNEITPIPPPKDWEKTDSVLIKCDGYWKIWSQVDLRWRAEGSGIVGGKEMSLGAKAKFEDFKKRYGQPPWDVVYYFFPKNFKNFKLADEIKPGDM